MKRRLRYPGWLPCLFLLSLMVCLGVGQVAPSHVQAETPNITQQVEQGVQRYQAGDYSGAIAVWKTALSHSRQTQNWENTAILVENLARAYQQLGQSEQAIDYWQQGVTLSRQLANLPQLGRMLTEQAQAYSRLGQPRQAIELLCNPMPQGTCSQDSALQIARTAQDSSLEAAALGSLGDAYRLDGDYNEAITVLQSGLALAEKMAHPAYQTAALTSLGNAYESRAQRSYRRATSALQTGDQLEAEQFQTTAVGDDTQALKYLQRSLEMARSHNDQPTQLRSLLSTIPLYYRTNDPVAATAALQAAKQLLNQLPANRNRVYAAIDLARLLQPVQPGAMASRWDCPTGEGSAQAEALLQSAVATAQRLQDQRAASFALGALGHVYECRAAYAQALTVSQQARWAAEQDLKSRDSLYLWEWQTARILKAQGQIQAAIAAYERAIATLNTIRSDILTASRDLQFDFRDTVEPVYRELVDLRLSLEPSAKAAVRTPSSADGSEVAQSKVVVSAAPASSADSQNLTTVLNTMDLLKVAELQNYFGDDCVVTVLNSRQSVQNQAKTATAIFSSIILPDRTAIIVSLPDQTQRVAWIQQPEPAVRQATIDFRRGLERFFKPFNPQQAQQLYDWFIRPFEADLAQAQIKTLVFVQDGILRSVPMAALHDGQQFLIQKYAIATTPSLTLTDFRPQDQGLRALALGLTQSATVDGQQFQALVNVSQEIQAVTAELPGSKPLLDQDFTRDRLQAELRQQSYSIIHIATHGQFGTDPDETFLVTGDSQKLTLTELDTLIRQFARGPETIDLLTLTACQTAVGDDRAALGLAGVAVQAGARSALASLWSVNDAATANVAAQFYQSLRRPDTSKAAALRKAQTDLIVAGGLYAHPAYWAPFILVGNWL